MITKSLLDSLGFQIFFLVIAIYNYVRECKPQEINNFVHTTLMFTIMRLMPVNRFLIPNRTCGAIRYTDYLMYFATKYWDIVNLNAFLAKHKATLKHFEVKVIHLCIKTSSAA